jgi:hypothetical protein
VICGRSAYFFAVELSLKRRAEADGVVLFWPAAGVCSGVLIELGRIATAGRLSLLVMVLPHSATRSRPS